jgi:hypothetical protein
MNDPMAVVTNANTGTVTQSTTKTNLYRAGVNQAPISNAATGNGTTYCLNFPQGCIYIAGNMNLFAGAATPAVGVANNLFTFMAQRWANSFGADGLGCVNLLGNGNLTNPITLTMDGNCMVIAATINTAACQAILNGQVLPAAGTSTASSAATGATSSTSKAAGSTASASKAASATSSAAAGGATSSSAAAGGSSTATSTAATATHTRRPHRGSGPGPRHQFGGKRMRVVRRTL